MTEKLQKITGELKKWSKKFSNAAQQIDALKNHLMEPTHSRIEPKNSEEFQAITEKISKL